MINYTFKTDTLIPGSRTCDWKINNGRGEEREKGGREGGREGGRWDRGWEEREEGGREGVQEKVGREGGGWERVRLRE